MFIPGFELPRHERTIGNFLTRGNRTLGLVSAAWIFIWISRQLSSSKNDSGHLTTRSLIVNLSMLPRRAVLLCPEVARRLSMCLCPRTGVRKVTCSPLLSWLFICADSFFFKKKKNKKNFLYLNQVSVAAPGGIFNYGRRSLSCSTWYLVPWPGIELWSPALRVWSSSHWTTREVLVSSALVGKHTLFFFFKENLVERKIASAFQRDHFLVGDVTSWLVMSLPGWWCHGRPLLKGCSLTSGVTPGSSWASWM